MPQMGLRCETAFLDNSPIQNQLSIKSIAQIRCSCWATVDYQILFFVGKFQCIFNKAVT
jgi:hypothetical protein